MMSSEVLPPPSASAAAAHPGVFTKRESIEDAVLLERQAVDLEHQGQDLASIRCMERALLLRCRDGGAVDEACLAAAERLVVKCNTVAVKSFKSDDYVTACTLLDNALRVTDGDTEPLRGFDGIRQKLRGTTLNNYGCLERRRGHLQESLQLLSMSLDFAGQQSPATYLNMSAICAQIGRQDEAVGHARRAIGLLERMGDTSGMLAIANHNLATALEAIDPAASEQAYNTALRIAMECFGQNSPTTQSIHRNMQRFHQRAKTVKPVTLPPIQSTTHQPKGAHHSEHHSSGRARSPPNYTNVISGGGGRKPAGGHQPPIPQQRLGTSSSTSSMPPSRSGRLPAMAASSPAPPSEPRQRPQSEPGGRKPPISSRPTTGESLNPGDRKPVAPAAALHPRPPPGDKRREAFGDSSDSTQQRHGAAGGKIKKPTASSARDTNDSPAANRRDSANTTPGVSPSTKELKTLSPRDRDLATPVSAGRGGTTPRAGAARLTPGGSVKAGGTPTTTAGPGEFLDVAPTLPQKTEDLATFMVTRLGTLLAAEEKFEQMYRQVVRIQCMYRKFRSRRELQRRRDARRRQARLYEITLHSAAKRIQRFLKANMRRRVLHQAVAAARQIDTDRKSKSAVVIQTIARRWLARRLVKAKRKLKNASLKAAVTLQKWFRKEIAIRHATTVRAVSATAKTNWLRDQKRWAAATRIQAAWRAAMARDATRDLRGTAMAARELARRNRCTTASLKVEAWWRGLMARRAYAKKHAARVLQRERLRAVERRRVATTILQGFARGIICRNRTTPMLAAQAKARIAKRDAECQRAAIRLQSWVRMFVARARFYAMITSRALRLRNRHHDAVARRIQRVLRAFGVRKAQGQLLVESAVMWGKQPPQPSPIVYTPPNQRTPPAEVATEVEGQQHDDINERPQQQHEVQPEVESSSVVGVTHSSQAEEEVPAVTLSVPDVQEDERPLAVASPSTAAVAAESSDASPVDGVSVFSAGVDTTTTTRALQPSPYDNGGVTPISPFSGGPLPEIVADSELCSGVTPVRDGAVNPQRFDRRSGSGLDVDRPTTPVNASVLDDDLHQGHNADQTSTPPQEVAPVVSVHAECPAEDSSAISEAKLEQPTPLVTPPVQPAVVEEVQEIGSVWTFKPRPPPPRRYVEKHNRAGATLVRVARGFLGRLYAKSVANIVHEYIDRLVERHVDSPNKAAIKARPMVHTLLDRFENDENVAKAKQKMLVTDLADEVVEFALNTSAVPATNAGENDSVVPPCSSNNNANEVQSEPAAATVQADEGRQLAALAVLQRSIRILLAKCKLARLREARRQRWEERRDNSGDNLNDSEDQ